MNSGNRWLISREFLGRKEAAKSSYGRLSGERSFRCQWCAADGIPAKEPLILCGGFLHGCRNPTTHWAFVVWARILWSRPSDISVHRQRHTNPRQGFRQSRIFHLAICKTSFEFWVLVLLVHPQTKRKCAIQQKNAELLSSFPVPQIKFTVASKVLVWSNTWKQPGTKSWLHGLAKKSNSLSALRGKRLTGTCSRYVSDYMTPYFHHKMPQFPYRLYVERKADINEIQDSMPARARLHKAGSESLRVYQPPLVIILRFFLEKSGSCRRGELASMVLHILEASKMNFQPRDITYDVFVDSLRIFPVTSWLWSFSFWEKESFGAPQILEPISLRYIIMWVFTLTASLAKLRKLMKCHLHWSITELGETYQPFCWHHPKPFWRHSFTLQVSSHSRNTSPY